MNPALRRPVAIGILQFSRVFPPATLARKIVIMTRSSKAGLIQRFQ
jgi:hypothetical protein